MYNFSYAEVLDDDPKEMRAREREALNRSIDMLEKAEAAGPNSREAVDANHFTLKLWSILIDDLGKEYNATKMVFFFSFDFFFQLSAKVKPCIVFVPQS